jgi:arylformamidase
MSRFHDISLVLGEQSIDFPGDEPLAIRRSAKLSEGDICNLTSLCMSAHAGTHLDSPAHLLPGGATLDSYALERFDLTAVVHEVGATDSIRAAQLDGLSIQAGQAILFKTDNSRSGRASSGRFDPAFVALGEDAAKRLVDMAPGLVGIDYISIEKSADDSYPVHRTLLGADVLILEGLNLAAVQAGRYHLRCAPLCIHSSEGAPCRAILES